MVFVCTPDVAFFQLVYLLLECVATHLKDVDSVPALSAVGCEHWRERGRQAIGYRQLHAIQILAGLLLTPRQCSDLVIDPVCRCGEAGAQVDDVALLRRGCNNLQLLSGHHALDLKLHFGHVAAQRGIHILELLDFQLLRGNSLLYAIRVGVFDLTPRNLGWEVASERV